MTRPLYRYHGPPLVLFIYLVSTLWSYVLIDSPPVKNAQPSLSLWPDRWLIAFSLSLFFYSIDFTYYVRFSFQILSIYFNYTFWCPYTTFACNNVINRSKVDRYLLHVVLFLFISIMKLVYEAHISSRFSLVNHLLATCWLMYPPQYLMVVLNYTKAFFIYILRDKPNTIHIWYFSD